MEPNAAIASENRDEWIERAPRTVATLLVGKLRHEGNPGQLCRVRNLSERGMQIDTIASLLPDMRITVELRGGALLNGAIAWTGGGRAGVRFDTPADVNAILGKPQPEAATVRPRSPSSRARGSPLSRIAVSINVSPIAMISAPIRSRKAARSSRPV